jgi:imidazolonepropionase
LYKNRVELLHLSTFVKTASMKILIKNIKGIVGIREDASIRLDGDAMKSLQTIENAYLAIENDRIVDYGPMDELLIDNWNELNIYDAEGRFVLPGFIDSHTHVVWAGNRESEFVDRINGMTYEEIANRGGGILNSAKKLSETSEEELYLNAKDRIEELMNLGTVALEIKSGYGLSVEGELKMLRVIKRLKESLPLPIKSTFLGAHAFPLEYRENQEAYIDLIINEMLPAIVKEGLADYIDAFLETGYFSVDQTKKIMAAGIQHGLIPKIHVNQFTAIGGVKAAVDHQALSVDHLEEMNAEDYEALKGSDTIAVALPGCSFFLSIPYTPAREIIDAGLPLALASDYNPGSTPSGNMQLVVAMACIKMKMTPEEAINAATLNAAYAVNLSDQLGSISMGKKASFFITKKIASYSFIPYAFGSDHIDTVFINGRIIRKGEVIV